MEISEEIKGRGKFVENTQSFLKRIEDEIYSLNRILSDAKVVRTGYSDNVALLRVTVKDFRHCIEKLNLYVGEIEVLVEKSV